MYSQARCRAFSDVLAGGKLARKSESRIIIEATVTIPRSTLSRRAPLNAFLSGAQRPGIKNKKNKLILAWGQMIS